MGIEAYLFRIHFEPEIEEEHLHKLLVSSGFEEVSRSGEGLSAYRSIYYECATDRGITEAHTLLVPQETHALRMYMRFSVVSPASVIDQTFELLHRMNQKFSIRVWDSEVSNQVYRPDLSKEEKAQQEAMAYIPIDAALFKQNPLGVNKRKMVIQEHGEEALLRSGGETMEYLHEKGRFERLFGWLFGGK